MLTIRPFTEEDLDAGEQLDRYAFQIERSAEELEERRKRAVLNQMWGCFVDGHLTAKVVILPLQFYIQGQCYSAGGIASVASWPEYRRRGHVRKLMEHALQVMYDAKQVISVLHPFSIPFYRQFGWEVLTDRRKYTIQVAQIPRFKSVGKMVRLSVKEMNVVQEVYAQYASRYSGMLIRTDDWWLEKIFNKKKFYVSAYMNEQNKCTGHLIYELNERKMIIRELIFLDADARQGIWQLIRNHDSMIETVIFQAPAAERVSLFLDTADIEQVVQRCGMFRIVDLKSFLEQYPFQAQSGTGEQAITTSCFLHVTDRSAPWNEGTFQIKFEHGRASVQHFKPSSAGTSCAHPPQRGLQGDISAFAAMFSGYARPEELQTMGQISGSENDLKIWEAILPQRQTFLNDYF